MLWLCIEGTPCFPMYVTMPQHSPPPDPLKAQLSESYGLTPAYLFNIISLHSTPAYLAPVPLVWILFQKHAKFIPISSALLFLLLGIPLPQIFA